jgi:ribonuclease HI
MNQPKDLPTVTIYTDGSCEPNPGPGGWAALLRFVEDLAALYAKLWVDGKLDQIRKESPDAPHEDE